MNPLMYFSQTIYYKMLCCFSSYSSLKQVNFDYFVVSLQSLFSSCIYYIFDLWFYGVKNELWWIVKFWNIMLYIEFKEIFYGDYENWIKWTIKVWDMSLKLWDGNYLLFFYKLFLLKFANCNKQKIVFFLWV